MKDFRRNSIRKGQILLVVFSLLLLGSLLTAGIAMLWQNRAQVSFMEKNALVAFYLANAGIERARAEIGIHQDDDYTGVINETLAGGFYNVTVSKHGNNRKDLVSIGCYRDAQRQISTEIVRDESGSPKGKAWGWHKKEANQWQEQ
jgi:hypothetical protein